MRPSSTPRQAASLSPPMFFAAKSTFCPSRRTPSTTSSEMLVALRSKRTRTTVPSRIRRTVASPAQALSPRETPRSRPFQASQSVLAFLHVRLTTSLPTAPPNRAASARLTRRVLVPDR